VLEGIPDNVWIGTSVENQSAVRERIPHLLLVPTKVRFLSCEPLLGQIDFGIFLGKNFCGKCHKWNTYWTNDGYNACCSHCLSDQRYPNYNYKGIHWVICGGESGHGARPMHPDWAVSLRDQCIAAKVPFFFKQWGEYVPVSFFSKEKKVIWFDREHPNVIYTSQPRMFAMYGDEGRTKAMQFVGKKTAGALLNGKEYKQFPILNP